MLNAAEQKSLHRRLEIRIGTDQDYHSHCVFPLSFLFLVYLSLIFILIPSFRRPSSSFNRPPSRQSVVSNPGPNSRPVTSSVTSRPFQTLAQAAAVATVAATVVNS